MSPQEKQFGIDLSDEVVRGSVVTYRGEILPPAPRPTPPPPPTAGRTTVPGEGLKDTSALALTPWQKTSREVTAVTAGMGAALALGKATSELFMNNVFVAGLAGLIGYRVVWGVTPALHSPLMSVTNAISGEKSLSKHHLNRHLCFPWFRHGRRRRFVYNGWRISPCNFPAGSGRIVSAAGIRQCLRWVRDHEAYARHVQT